MAKARHNDKKKPLTYSLRQRKTKCVSGNVCHVRNALIQKLKMLYTSNLAIKQITSRIVTSDKRNRENRAFRMRFMHLRIKIQEKPQKKTKLTETKL